MAGLTRITGRDIKDSTITNADISPTAGIAISKINGLQTALDGKESSLPSVTGNSGKVLGTDGVNKSWVTAGGGMSKSNITTSSLTLTAANLTDIIFLSYNGSVNVLLPNPTNINVGVAFKIITSPVTTANIKFYDNSATFTTLGASSEKLLTRSNNTSGSVGYLVSSNENYIKKSTITAKGDIILGSGSASPAALPVGTDWSVLIADSSSTNNVRWGMVPHRITSAFGTFNGANGQIFRMEVDAAALDLYPYDLVVGVKYSVLIKNLGGNTVTVTFYYTPEINSYIYENPFTIAPYGCAWIDMIMLGNGELVCTIHNTLITTSR